MTKTYIQLYITLISSVKGKPLMVLRDTHSFIDSCLDDETVEFGSLKVTQYVEGGDQTVQISLRLAPTNILTSSVVFGNLTIKQVEKAVRAEMDAHFHALNYSLSKVLAHKVQDKKL